MKQIKLLCIIFMLLCATVYSVEYPYGTLIRGVKPNGTYSLMQLDANGNVKVSGSFSATTTIDTSELESAVASTTTAVTTEGDQTQGLIANVTGALVGTNLKLDGLAEILNSLATITVPLASNTSMIQSEGNETQLAIASVTGAVASVTNNTSVTNSKLDILNASTTASLASVTSAINSTPTVKLYPIVTASQSVILLTDTEFLISVSANSKYIHLISTGTFIFSIASTTVDINTTPCYNATIESFSDMILSVKRVGTDTYLTVREWNN